MTTRSCRKPLVCSTILALFLLICTTPATAQLLPQDAAQIEANTPPWLQTPRTDPTAPLPEVRQAVTTNLETARGSSERRG